MPRNTDIKRRGTIPIPKDMDRMSEKVEIISATDGQTYDVTEDIIPNSGSLEKLATVGLSQFSFMIDNTEGKYNGKFANGDVINFYFDLKVKADLTNIHTRALLDNAFINVDEANGWTLIIEGRDSPKSSSNDHFADTDISLQFTARNNLDVWFGTTGTVDSEGNFPDGILFNSGLIFQVFDTADNTWKTYSSLSAGQKTTLKAQTGYTQTHTETYVDKSRLTMSQSNANEGDYDFHIFFNNSDSKLYFRVHPEEAILNSSETVSIGQNFIGLNRQGVDTLEEFNRIKEVGESDGTILLFSTKEDTTRQSASWIKDKKENASGLTTETEISAKATARLNQLKNGLNKGGLDCCILPTLQAGEKVPINISYAMNNNFKVKSYTINFGGDIQYNLQLQDRETTFGRIFKDRIDETVNVTPTDNPNGLRNAIVFDFTGDPTRFDLTDCTIENDALVLDSGTVVGICKTPIFTADNNVTQLELRIKANQSWKTTYRISNNGGDSFENLTIGRLHTFTSVGTQLQLEATLRESTSGVSPQFEKFNFLYT